jgi:hypothetical protein
MTSAKKLASFSLATAITLAGCSQAGNSSVATVPAVGQSADHVASAQGRVRPNTSPYTYVVSTPAPGAIAFCPSGQKAVGGGFSNANVDSQTTASHSAGAYNGSWKSVDSGGGSITSYVICVGSAFTTNYQTASWNGAVSGEAEGIINCPSGYEASGGGFDLTSGTVGNSNPFNVVSSSTPIGWKAGGNVKALSSGTAYGTCVKTTSYAIVTNSGTNSVTATCPSGDVAIGGGFYPNGIIYANFIITSSRDDDSHKAWLVTGVNGSTNELTSYAICAPNSTSNR